MIEIDGKVIGAETRKAMYIDHKAFIELNAKQMTEFYSTMPKDKEVKHLSDFKTFINRFKVPQALLQGEDIAERIEAIRGTPLTDDEQSTLATFAEVYNKARQIAFGHEYQTYTLEPVPDGIDLSTHFSISKTTIKRLGCAYKMTKVSFEKMWDHVKNYWAELEEKPRNSLYLRCDGYEPEVVVLPDRSGIKLSCQILKRWEVEQVALMLGLDFPAAIKKEAV